jgi:hypothetical protein
VWTEWWDEDLAPLFPDTRTRELVERQQRRLPLAYFAGPLPLPRGWAERPAAYLAFGDTYADEVAFARDRGWPVSALPAGTSRCSTSRSRWRTRCSASRALVT